jgi:DNA-binding response OmpR family regulator
MRVLIVEDEQKVAANIATALRESSGYAVDLAPDGARGVDLASEIAYDLIILDLMLPRMTGMQVLEYIRHEKSAVPVLVLTASSEKQSIIALLNAGADDYMAKPFDLGELLARSKALIRRGKGVCHPHLSFGELHIDTIEKSVALKNVPVELSPTEYRILEYLMHHPRSIVSKQGILEHLYDYNWERHSNVIEAHVSNLRRKLSAPNSGPNHNSYIQTLRGRGYRLALPPAASCRNEPGTDEPTA